MNQKPFRLWKMVVPFTSKFHKDSSSHYSKQLMFSIEHSICKSSTHKVSGNCFHAAWSCTLKLAHI
jgi:hypothetical protein